MKTKDSPLSIFLLIRSLAVGGAQRQLVHLAVGLNERHCRVCVGIFYPDGPLIADLENRGISVIHLRKRGRWDAIGFVWRLARAIRAERPDVVYSFVGTANIFAALAQLLTPAPAFVWSIRASDMDLGHYDWAHRLGYGLERRLARFAKLIISNSRAGLEFAVAHGFPRERIAVVPNGIDTVRFRPDASMRREQRLAWGLGESEVAVGMLARLDPMKGHVDFLRAAGEVKRTMPRTRFVLIGDGPEKERLRALARDLSIADVVSFTGATNDPAAALNALDVFCSASIWGEGLSNAVAEAMACGLPCIVTDVGDSAAIVGRCGAVVGASHPHALAVAIIGQVQQLGEGHSSAARARIAKGYTIDSMVDRTLHLLRTASLKVSNDR